MNATKATTTARADESAPASIDPAAAWEAAHAAFMAALAEQNRAIRATRKAVNAMGDAAMTCVPHVFQQPAILPFVKAEADATERALAARDALLVTEAPDWFAFATKFHVLRQWLDDILNPLDPRDFNYSEKAFPGTRTAARIHHLALAAHHGLVRVTFLPAIPKLIKKMVRKADLAERLSDPKTLTDLAASPDGVLRGLASVYGDALRLSAAAVVSALPPTAADGPSPIEVWATERNRLWSEAAGIPDHGPDCTEDGLARQAYLEARAGRLEQLIRNSPCDSDAAAIGKLKWIAQSFGEGATGDEQRVMDQVLAYLAAASLVSGDSEILAIDVATGDHPDAALLALAPELERRWKFEHETQGGASNEKLDADCAHTGEIAHRIHKIVPRTIEGARVRARAAAWHRCAYDQPFLAPDESPGTDEWASARLIDDLLAGVPTAAPSPHPDQLLLDAVDAYRQAANIRDTILGNAAGADPQGEDLVRYDAAGDEMERLFDRTRQLRATTPEGIRAKALLANYWQPTADFDGYEQPGWMAARSLLADILGRPSIDCGAQEQIDWDNTLGWNLDLGEEVLVDPRSRPRETPPETAQAVTHLANAMAKDPALARRVRSLAAAHAEVRA